MNPTLPRRVPVRLVARFPPVDTSDWRRLDNNAKAKLGKDRFLRCVRGAKPATGDDVRSWLRGLGIDAARKQWVEVFVAQDLSPRYLSDAFSTRCVDAFIELADRRMEGVELKVSGDDGVCGLTVAEERLLRAGHVKVYAVNPVKGLIGVMDSQRLLEVPRRVDGIPVGEARLEWIEDRARSKEATMVGVPRELAVDDPVILLRINKNYRPGMSPDELYQATRYAWKVGRRREGARFACAVFEGVVSEVYEIGQWREASPGKGDKWAKGERWEFDGQIANESVRSKYVGRSVKSYFAPGAQNPITYVNC